MPIPDIKNIRLPLLELTGDGKDWQRREASTVLAERLGLTEREKKELVPSGGQPKFHNRVQWAIWGLKAAGLLESPRRGYFRITERGRSVLNEKPSTIDRSFLKQFPEFRAALKPRRPRTRKKVPVEPESGGFAGAPEEAIESAYRVRRESLAAELLQSVLEAPPEFFERLVVDLLVQMGYGGSREEAGEAIGQSGDEGIDGRIKEDRLGLDVVYIQAKRWQQSVGRPEVQRFAGALQGQRARKGVFITTSNFSAGARDYVRNIDAKIVLMDGSELVAFMMDHDVGVATEATYVLKKLDSDYFPDP